MFYDDGDVGDDGDGDALVMMVILGSSSTRYNYRDDGDAGHDSNDGDNGDEDASMMMVVVVTMAMMISMMY